MAEEFIDPEMVAAFMEAARRQNPGAGPAVAVDAVGRAASGMDRTPLPSEYAPTASSMGDNYLDHRQDINQGRWDVRPSFLYPRTDYGYQDTGSDIRGTVAEQIMSMMPPQEPLPGRTAGPPPSHPYNTEFSDLVRRPPARGHVSSLPPRASALPSFRTEHLPPPELYSNWDERPDPRLERISSRGGAYDWEPSWNVSPPGAAPDPGRDARVEQLMRELEEQQALEARLRALGR